jgi:aminoglycoside 6'-N-acetyltransferase I
VARYAEWSPLAGREKPLGRGEGLVLRVATPGDRSALCSIAAERSGRKPLAHRAGFTKLLGPLSRRGSARVLVAEWEGRVVGFGVSRRFRPSPKAAPNAAPAGWYLAGMIVTPSVRRRGIGRLLVQARLEWIAQRSGAAYYVANVRNVVSIELHRRVGFVEQTRDFTMPGVRFDGSSGALFRIELQFRSPSADT